MNIESTEGRNQSSIELRAKTATFGQRLPLRGGCRSLGRMTDGGIEGMVLEATSGHASGYKPSTKRRCNSKSSHGRIEEEAAAEEEEEEEIITEVVAQ